MLSEETNMIASTIVKELSGSFADIVTVIDSSYLEKTEFNETKLDLEGLPNDMEEEIAQFLAQEGGEVLVAKYNNATFCLIPAWYRGGVCTNGYTQWTDCETLDELEERYLADDFSN